MSLAYLIACVLPTVAGASVFLALSPARCEGWRSATAGYGIVLGLLLTSALTALTARADKEG